MVGVSTDLERTERRLRQAVDSYSEARVSGDILDTLLSMQAALEDALDAHLVRLGFERQDIGRFSFAEKAGEVLPTEVLDRFDVDELLSWCTDYADPDQPVQGRDCRNAADQLVALTLAAWKDLFVGSAPDVEHPPLLGSGDLLSLPQLSELKGALSRLLGQRDVLSAKIEERDAEIERLYTRLADQGARSVLEPVKRKIPWSALFLGVLSALPMAWLAGFSEHLWREMPTAWYWLPIPVGLLAVFSFYAMRSLWRFLCCMGGLRIITTLCVGLVIATSVLTPFTDPDLGWPHRAGVALTRVLNSIGCASSGLVSTFFDTGAALARRSFPLRAPSPVAEEMPGSPTYAP